MGAEVAVGEEVQAASHHYHHLQEDVVILDLGAHIIAAGGDNDDDRSTGDGLDARALAATGAIDPEDSQLEVPLLVPASPSEKARSEPPPDLSERDDDLDDTDVQAEIITLGRKVAGETIASFVVIFTLIAVKLNTYGYGAVSTLATSLMGGLVVMVAIFSFGHVSGSHINPAVTIAYTMIRHFPLQLAPCYIFAHLLGAIAASGMAELVFSSSKHNIMLVTPIDTVLHSLLAETLGGFLLLLVASSVSTDTRAIGQFAGLAVGAIIAIEIMIVGPVSGGALNPARALGPAIVRWNFENVWIYLVGPIVGGLLGALVYRLLRPEEVRKLGVHQPIHLHSIHRSFRSFRTNNGRTTSLSSRFMNPFFAHR